MHIHWLAPEPFDNIHALYATPLASLRLRAGALLSVLPAHTALTAGPIIPPQAQVCVIGKIGVADLLNRQAQWLDQIHSFKGPVVLDFTDDHLTVASKMSDFYVQALAKSQLAVCSSSWLQAQLSKVFSGPVHVIADAIECPIIPPKSKLADTLQVLWFGHSTNLPALIDFLPSLPQALTVHILTNTKGIQQIQGLMDHPNGLTLVPAIWSPTGMVKTALKCQMCIIPVGLDNAKKAGVSSNRLLTALALGLPTSADVADSYGEFRNDFADLRSAEFTDMLISPESWHSRVQSAQAHTLPAYTFPKLGQQWLKLLQSLS
jgi:hypothetical protein